MRDLIRLLSSLESRGIRLEASPGTILARPAAALNTSDKEGITRHKPALLTLALHDPHDARVILDPPDFAQGAVQMRELLNVTLAGIPLLVTPAEWIQLGEEWWDSSPPATTTTTPTPAASTRQRSLFGVTA